MRTSSALCSAVACCVVSSICFELPAQAESAEAERSRKNLEQHDHRRALELLEEAYALEPSPDLLLQLADAYETLALKGDDRRDIRLALSYFQQYVLTRPSVPLTAIENRRRVLRELLASLGPEDPESPAAADTLPERPSAVRVSFVADDSARPFEVTVGQSSCETPCSLQLAPGGHLLNLAGADSLKLGLYVPDAAGTVRLVQSGRRYLIPGILLTVAGAVIAGVMWMVSDDCPPTVGCGTANLVVWPLVGAAVFATGVGLLGYYGSHQLTKADVDVDAVQSALPPPPIRLASFGLQPLRGGAAMGAGISF